MTYTETKITELENKISKIQIELNYFKACAFLENLEATAMTTLVDYLADHYGVKEVKSFPNNEISQSWCESRQVRNIKEAVSRYKQKTDSKKNPSWATKAMKAAITVDQHDEK